MTKVFTSLSRADALVFSSVLESCGIENYIKTNEFAGSIPVFTRMEGFAVFVSDEDCDDALKAAEDFAESRKSSGSRHTANGGTE